MSKFRCGREEELLRAARSDQWEPETRRHLASCPLCQSNLRSDWALSVLAASEQPNEINLHQPAALWWRARIDARRSQLEDAVKPIRIAEKIGLGAAAAGTALVSSFLLPPLWRIWRDWIGKMQQSLGSIDFSGLMLLAGAAMLFLLVVGTYSQWAEG